MRRQLSGSAESAGAIANELALHDWISHELEKISQEVSRSTQALVLSLRAETLKERFRWGMEESQDKVTSPPSSPPSWRPPSSGNLQNAAGRPLSTGLGTIRETEDQGLRQSAEAYRVRLPGVPVKTDHLSWASSSAEPHGFGDPRRKSLILQEGETVESRAMVTASQRSNVVLREGDLPERRRSVIREGDHREDVERRRSVIFREEERLLEPASRPGSSGSFQAALRSTAQFPNYNEGSKPATPIKFFNIPSSQEYGTSSSQALRRGMSRPHLIFEDQPSEVRQVPGQVNGSEDLPPTPLIRPLSSASVRSQQSKVSSQTGDGDAVGDEELTRMINGLEKSSASLFRSRARNLGARPPRYSVTAAVVTSKQSGPSLLDSSLSCKELFNLFIERNYLEFITMFVLLLNTLTIGLEADMLARSLGEGGEDSAVGLEVLDKLLCAYFVLEMGLRLAYARLGFFIGPGFQWNLFDLLTTVLQVVEETMRIVRLSSSSSGSKSNTFVTVMRTLRVLRVVRVMRLFRMVRYLSELHLIVVSIMTTLKSLMWTILLLLTVIYIFAVFYTTLAANYQMGANGALQDAHSVNIIQNFGSLPMSIFTLYSVITGGVNWRDVTLPLVMNINPGLGIVMSLYVAMSMFCIMNVVTGVFVDAALRAAKSEEQNFIIENLHKIFQDATRESEGQIRCQDFVNQVHTKAFRQYFESIEVDPGEAEVLFRLLDVDDSGSVDVTEFIDGCLRLRGQAKAIDVMSCLQDTRRLVKKFDKHREEMDDKLAQLASSIRHLRGAMKHLATPEPSEQLGMRQWVPLEGVVEGSEWEEEC